MNSPIKPLSPSAGDRRIAALAHLGVPIYGPFLPLTIYFASKSRPFRQRHANQAFAFQGVFFSLWLILIVLYMAEVVDTVRFLPAVLAIGFVIEIPNVIQALRGRPPIVFIPLELLRSRTSDAPPPPTGPRVGE